MTDKRKVKRLGPKDLVILQQAKLIGIMDLLMTTPVEDKNYRTYMSKYVQYKSTLKELQKKIKI